MENLYHSTLVHRQRRTIRLLLLVILGMLIAGVYQANKLTHARIALHGCEVIAHALAIRN